MLARQQELKVQSHPPIDAFIPAFSLFAAPVLLFYGAEWLDLRSSLGLNLRTPSEGAHRGRAEITPPFSPNTEVRELEAKQIAERSL